MTRDEFMTEISKVTEDFVARTTGFTESAENLKETELVSPLNGEPIYEGLSFYQNLSGEFKISISIAGRRLEVDEVSTLLKDKRVGPLDDFIAKTGRKFSAMLQLEEDLKVSFVFNNNEEQESEENDQMKDSPVVAACPMCSGDIKQTEISYICTDHKKVSEGTCSFRVTRKLLDRDIPLDEFVKLVKEKKTSLLKGFVSRRTIRPFDANLILKDNGGIGFEFPPRKKKSA